MLLHNPAVKQSKETNHFNRNDTKREKNVASRALQ